MKNFLLKILCRLDIPIEELIERERKNLGTIMDNVEDEEKENDR